MKHLPGEKAEKILYTHVEKIFSGRDALYINNYPVFMDELATRYELDMLIVDREYGLINIEVKGLRIANISEIKGHIWRCKGHLKEFIEPFRQAERQMNALFNNLSKNRIIRNDISRKVLICLPYISKDEWSKKGFDKLGASHIIFKDDMQSDSLLNVIEKTNLHKAYPDFVEEDFERLGNFLGFEEKEENSTQKIFSLIYGIDTNERLVSFESEIKNYLQSGAKVYVIRGKKLKDKLDLDKHKIYEDVGNLSYFNSDYDINSFFRIDDGKGITHDIDIILESTPSFNYRQYKAVHFDHNIHLMIEASAGTGKTYLLVDRLLYLINVASVNINDITLITFTNEAKDEMKSRIRTKLVSICKTTNNSTYMDILENINELKISTIHSYAKQIIKEHADILGIAKQFNVTSMKHKKYQIVELALDEFFKENNYEIDEMIDYKDYQLVKFILMVHGEIEKKVLDYDEISKYRIGKDSKLISEILKFVLPRIDNQMLELKEEDSSFEVNDLIRMLGRINVNTTSDIGYKYLMIDEFQDSDSGQIDFFGNIMNKLGYKVFAIGDIKQSI